MIVFSSFILKNINVKIKLTYFVDVLVEFHIETEISQFVLFLLFWLYDFLLENFSTDFLLIRDSLIPIWIVLCLVNKKSGRKKT